MNCLYVAKNDSFMLLYAFKRYLNSISALNVSANCWLRNDFDQILNLTKFKLIYQSFLFFMQVLNLVILRESESILHESAWLL